MLKNGLSSLTLSAKSIAGVRRELGQPAASDGSIEIERYRGKGFPDTPARTLNVVSADACQEACSTDQSCIAYTFLKSGQICKIFEDTGEYFSNADADSGVKLQKP